MSECTVHHQACACREERLQVLIGTAETCSMELDHLKNLPGVASEERARLAAVVDACQEAIEKLKPKRIVGCQRPGTDCVLDNCDECRSAIWEGVPRLVEAAHMFPSDLARFQTEETFAQAFSVKVGSPEEVTVPVYVIEEETRA